MEKGKDAVSSLILGSVISASTASGHWQREAKFKGARSCGGGEGEWLNRIRKGSQIATKCQVRRLGGDVVPYRDHPVWGLSFQYSNNPCIQARSFYLGREEKEGVTLRDKEIGQVKRGRRGEVVSMVVHYTPSRGGEGSFITWC